MALQAGIPSCGKCFVMPSKRLLSLLLIRINNTTQVRRSRMASPRLLLPPSSSTPTRPRLPSSSKITWSIFANPSNENCLPTRLAFSRTSVNSLHRPCHRLFPRSRLSTITLIRVSARVKTSGPVLGNGKKVPLEQENEEEEVIRGRLRSSARNTLNGAPRRKSGNV